MTAGAFGKPHWIAWGITTQIAFFGVSRGKGTCDT